MKLMKGLMAGVLALSCMGTAQAKTGLSPWIQYWDSEFGGNIGAGGATATIRKADDASVGFGLKLHILGFNSKLSYQDLSYNTKIDAQAGFKFDGKTYTVADTLNLDYKWDTIDWSFRWGPQIGGNNKVDFRLLGGVQVIDAAVDITGATGTDAGKEVHFDETIPLPYIGFEGGIKMNNKLRLESSLKMLNLSLSSNDLDYSDFEIGLRYFINKRDETRGSIFLGFRKKELDVVIDEGSTDEAAFDTEIDGIFAAYRFHF